MGDWLLSYAMGMSRTSSAAVSVRLILLGGCVWLLGSWAVVLLVGPNGLLGASRGGAQWMAVAAVAGLTLAWPAARLAEGWAEAEPLEVQGEDVAQGAAAPWRNDTPGWGTRVGVLLADWVGLNGALQAVFWPLLLTAGWSWQQAAYLAAGAAAWSLVVAAVVAVGRWRDGEAWRTLAMVVVLLVVVGPLLADLMPLGVDVVMGPLQLAWHATDFGASAAGWQTGLWISLATASATGVLAWAALGVAGVLPREPQAPANASPAREPDTALEAD